MNMEIKIEIESPPKGCSRPQRSPVYLPFDKIFILIGKCWVKAEDHLKYGGNWHIWCYKLDDDIFQESE